MGKYLLHPMKVDDREKDPSPTELVEGLRRIDVPASIARIPDSHGDIMWVAEPTNGDPDAWVVAKVERKRIQDLLSSTRDGRLARFVESPRARGELRFLLVEGDAFRFSNYGKREWSPEELDNLLVSVQLTGVQIVRSANSAATPMRLKKLWHWTGKDEHGSWMTPVLPETRVAYINPSERERVRNLMTLPGWGEDRARAAERHFRSLDKVYAAILARDFAAFRDIPGIGKGLVEKAARFLEERYNG